LITPPLFAAANEGISAPSADPAASIPAPVAALRVRNCLRSVPVGAAQRTCAISFREIGRL
jgi:hypothetical protein